MTIEDLRKDEAGLIAQMNQIQGAVTYIRQKIAALETTAKSVNADKPKKNGKAPDKVEARQEPVEA